MPEINERWTRDNRFLKRTTGYGVIVSVALWPVSYLTSFHAATAGQGMWFSVVSIATLAAAIGCTAATVFGVGCVYTDEPPLPGSNNY